MGDEALKIGKWTDDIGIGVPCAIRPWSRWTRVEVKYGCLLVLGSRLLCKLKVALEEIVFATP